MQRAQLHASCGRGNLRSLACLPVGHFGFPQYLPHSQLLLLRSNAVAVQHQQPVHLDYGQRSPRRRGLRVQALQQLHFWLHLLR